jgi:hypothetical protein
MTMWHSERIVDVAGEPLTHKRFLLISSQSLVLMHCQQLWSNKYGVAPAVLLNDGKRRGSVEPRGKLLAFLAPSALVHLRFHYRRTTPADFDPILSHLWLLLDSMLSVFCSHLPQPPTQPIVVLVACNHLRRYYPTMQSLLAIHSFFSLLLKAVNDMSTYFENDCRRC